MYLVNTVSTLSYFLEVPQLGEQIKENSFRRNSHCIIIDFSGNVSDGYISIQISQDTSCLDI